MANSTINLKLFPFGKGGRSVILPVHGGSHIRRGTLVSQLTATSMLCPGSTAMSGAAVGVAEHESDNSSGADGDTRVKVLYDEIYVFDNAGGGDACSEALSYGAPLFMLDDHTIANSSKGSTLEPAGRYVGMEPNGRVKVFLDIDQPASGTNGTDFDSGISTDTINEHTANAGVAVDGILLKDSIVHTDNVVETTADAGVTIDGVLVKDTIVSASGGLAVGIAAPNANAVLDLVSTTKCAFFPRMTTGQRDAVVAPGAGAVIYNTTTDKLNVYTGAAWEAVTSA